MEKVVPRTIRLVTLAGLLLLIAQLLLAYAKPDWVWYFPPLLPQLVVLLVLIILSVIFGRGSALNGLVMILAVVMTVLLLFGSFAVFGFTTLRQNQLCLWTHEALPEERKAEVQLPEDTTKQPEVSLSWPGDYTCTWTDPESGEERASYTQSVLVMVRNFGTLWS
ncbi:MAG: hypothetical protein R2722_00770 [Tessaracoccus sp.]